MKTPTGDTIVGRKKDLPCSQITVWTPSRGIDLWHILESVGIDLWHIIQSEEEMKVAWDSRKSVEGLPILQQVSSRRWLPPPSNILKVNVDGAVCCHSGRAAIGCVGRDSGGGWIEGEAWNVGEATVIKAELLAVYYGLHLAWKLGVQSVILETDSQQAVDIICNGAWANEELNGVVDACKELIHREWKVIVVHIYREANAVADWIARWGLSQPLGRSGIGTPPNALVNLMLLDCNMYF